MSRHEPKITLWQMHDHLLHAQGFIDGLSPDLLEADLRTHYALERAITVIGEAVTRLPDEFMARHPDIPWQQIRGARNVLVHGCDAIDPEKFWDIVATRLPELRLAIEAILVSEGWPKPA